MLTSPKAEEESDVNEIIPPDYDLKYQLARMKMNQNVINRSQGREGAQAMKTVLAR